MVDVVTFDLGVPAAFPYGMRSPHTRSLVVDAGGKGNHTTITAALAEASATGAASGTRWDIYVKPGVYAESPDVPSYVSMYMPMGTLATITGTLTMRGRAELIGGQIFTTNQVGVKMICDISGVSPRLTGTTVYVNAAVDGVVAAVEGSGPVFSNAYVILPNCDLYARNTHTGANAKAAVFHLKPGSGMFRAYGGHYKLSAGAGGTAQLILAYNQGTHQYEQMNISGVAEIYNAASFYLMLSTNSAAQHGGYINCPWAGWTDEYTSNYTIPAGIVSDVAAKPNNNHYRNSLISLDVRETLTINSARVLPANTLYPFVSGSKYDSQWFTATYTNDNPSVGRLVVSPLMVGNAGTANQVEVAVSTAVAGSAGRIAIYRDSMGVPTTKVLDTGASSFSAATTGDKTIAVSVALEPGLYWVGVGTDVASSAVGYTGATGRAPMMHQDSTAAYISYYMDYTPNTASLPSTFSVTGRRTAAPRVRVRAA